VGGNYRLVPGVTFYADYSKSFLPQSGMVYDGSSSGSFANPEEGDQWEGRSENLPAFRPYGEYRFGRTG